MYVITQMGGYRIAGLLKLTTGVSLSCLEHPALVIGLTIVIRANQAIGDLSGAAIGAHTDTVFVGLVGNIHWYTGFYFITVFIDCMTSTASIVLKKHHQGYKLTCFQFNLPNRI